MRSRTVVPLFTAVLLAWACGEDATGPEGPTMATVAGSYIAEEFTTTENDSTVDRLAEGASVQIELSEEGTTTGRMFVPGGDEDGSDYDADLQGTWSLQGDTVHFSHDADTFIRDTPFRVDDGRLVGDRTFGGVRVRLVLGKQ